MVAGTVRAGGLSITVINWPPPNLATLLVLTIRHLHRLRMIARPFSVRVRTLVVASLVLAACGGGSDANGPGGGGATEGVLIEGNISGLQGSGLVLQLNGGRDVTVNPGAPKFFFVDVPKKTAYTITVKTQPATPSQTCSVGNGTGVATADINNVTLTCTTNTYAVSGTIAGLTGAGLALQLTGGATQTMNVGATTFSFAGIPSETPFAITITAQPSAQTCALNNGSGQMHDADVTNLTVTCGAPGLTIGGAASGLAGQGLTLRLNGGPPLTVAGGSAAFTFPNAVPQGTVYSVVIVDYPKSPRQSCAIARAKGRVGASNVTDLHVNCRGNALLAGYDGTYATVVNGMRDYLTLWSDGAYSFAVRSNDPTCPNNGNGSEYGVYRRQSDASFSIVSAMTDRNGGCGIWDSQASPPSGLSGTLSRNGDVLTLVSSEGTFVLNAVESIPTSLVGAFTRADGVDGSFVVFESDGTYLYQEAQDAGSLGNVAGYERGCYTVSGSTFTVSLAATCLPNGISTLDLNNRSGFSASNGAPIPFVITSATTATIGGVEYRRLVPGG